MNLLVLLLWLAIAYSLLFVLRFLLAARFSGIFLLLTNRSRWGRVAFNILLFPGVIIHELSHFLMAATLGVPTGDIAIFPHTEDGEERLGSVKIAQTDPVRASIIGAAPLIIASISLVALTRWQFAPLFTSSLISVDPLILIQTLLLKLATLQTWAWFYLIFALANTMFTSKSDRRGWPFLAVLIVLLTVVFYGLGLITIFSAKIFKFLTDIITQLNIAFTLTISVDLLFLAFLWLVEKLISVITGRHLRYSRSF